MTEIESIFGNLGVYAGLVAVLLGALYYFIKVTLKQNEQHLDYLRTQNERLTNIIADCTKALNDNTKAFNELIKVLDDFKKRKVPD